MKPQNQIENDSRVLDGIDLLEAAPLANLFHLEPENHFLSNN